jgi:hypothetical protein
LVGKPEGNRPLVQTRYGWEHTEIILKEMGLKGMDRIHLAQNMDQW